VANTRKHFRRCERGIAKRNTIVIERRVLARREPTAYLKALDAVLMSGRGDPVIAETLNVGLHEVARRLRNMNKNKVFLSEVHFAY
jgi:hypothetical protein